MLRASKPLTLHQARTYYTREYARGDYYIGGAGTPAEEIGVWQGRGAVELGLVGAVDRERFQELLAGRLGGVRLVAPEAATGVHRAAWDFQVAPDKSVSLVALVGGDERVVTAHRAAAAEAFGVLERHATAKDRARQLVLTGNLTAARFDHDSSRSLDPQLHSHQVVFNLTRRPDGAWRGLESRSLFRVQSLATATYQLELGRRLQDLGYALDVDGRGHVRIAGIPEAARLHFSRRRREILAEMARQEGVKDAQRAALKTRQRKDHGVDRAALRRSWVATAERLGVDFAGLRREAAARLAGGGGRPVAGVEGGAGPVVSWAVSHLAERQAVFSRIDLETTALRHATGRGLTAAEVRAALASPAGVVAGPDDRLTTRAALALETANLERMREAVGERRPAIVPGRWEAADLAPDQLRVARHILESQAQLVAVEGKPGTGKTHTLARVRAVAAERGWTVRGFAVTTGAVEELSKVGIAAATVKSLEQAAVPTAATPTTAPRRELWIVDEAGLLGNRDAGTLLARARLAGARTVLVGDRRQHHAVAAGKPFVELQRAGLSAVRLDAIRRQQVPELLAAVRLSADGQAGRAVEQLARHGHVVEIRAAGARHQAMARAYVDSPAGTLMIAPSHAERMALNQLVRRELVAGGRVEAGGVTVEVAVSKGLTAAERADVRGYQVGDVVTFRRGAPRRGLRAGEAARVVAVDGARHTVTVERLRPPAGGEAILTYDPRLLRGVEVARVERREVAAGDHIVFRQPHRTAGGRVANGAAATVVRVDGAGIAVELERRPGGPHVVLEARGAPLPIDHGYAVTSHAAQGRTVHTVLATVDVEHGAELVNRQQLNVTISRATHGLRLYTNDRAGLAAAVDRAAPKASALDVTRTERRPDHALEEAPPSPAGRAGRGTRGDRAGAGGGRGGAAARERAGGRERAARTHLARDAGGDGRPARGVQPRRRSLRPPEPARNAFGAAVGESRGGGGRGGGHSADARRDGAGGRSHRRAARPVSARLKERLAGAWARWQAWASEREGVAREIQAVRVEMARRRAAPGGGAAREGGAGRGGGGERGRGGRGGVGSRGGGGGSGVPVLAARLLRLQGRLAILTRSRSVEEMLLRAVRQVGVSQALALLPKSAAPVILALRLARGAVQSLGQER